MTCGIYAIYSPINNTYYIGQSVDITRRVGGHKHELMYGNHRNIHLQSAWNKYGEQEFIFSPLFKCGLKELTKYEQLVCDIAKKGGLSLYNKRVCVDSNAGVPLDADHRRKIGEARTGKFILKNDRPEQCLYCSCKVVASRGRLYWYCTECKKQWLKNPLRTKPINRPIRCPLCKNKKIISAGPRWRCHKCNASWKKPDPLICAQCGSDNIASRGNRWGCRECGKTWKKVYDSSTWFKSRRDIELRQM
jgi:group I intron endonuclease